MRTVHVLAAAAALAVALGVVALVGAVAGGDLGTAWTLDALAVAILVAGVLRAAPVPGAVDRTPATGAGVALSAALLVLPVLTWLAARRPRHD